MIKEHKINWFATPVSPNVKLIDETWTVIYSEVSNWWLFDWVSLWSLLFLKRFNSSIFFTGRLYKVLVDSKCLHRNQMSILRTSDIDSFLELLNNKLTNFQFQIFKKSLKGVQSGLINKISDNEGVDIRSTRKVGMVYLIHVFQCSIDFNNQEMNDKLSELDVFVHFKGVRSALIGYEEGKKKTIPFALDGLLVLAAFEEVQFDELLEQNWYVDFMNINHDNFIGLFKREF